MYLEPLETMFDKGIAGLKSMQSMRYESNQDKVMGNSCTDFQDLTSTQGLAELNADYMVQENESGII